MGTSLTATFHQLTIQYYFYKNLKRAEPFEKVELNIGLIADLQFPSAPTTWVKIYIYKTCVNENYSNIMHCWTVRPSSV